jgi:hypothetical protein
MGPLTLARPARGKSFMVPAVGRKSLADAPGAELNAFHYVVLENTNRCEHSQ